MMFCCYYWGGEKLGRPVLSPPWKVKASTLCRWLSGWRKTGPAHSFPTQTSENINHTLSWICKQSWLFRGWGKTGPAHSFPNPDKIRHQPCADGYLGGEKLGWSVIFPPWQVKASTLPCHEYTYNLCLSGGGERLVKVSVLCRCLSGWRKTRLVHYFPTLTSESINLTLSWICKQLLLFRGWGKTGPSHSFPTLTSVSINLVQKLGYLGGEKLGRPILSPPRLVKVSTLPCHEYANNLCFLGGGGKTGPAHSFPTLTSVNIYLVQKLGYLGGEKLGWPILSPPRLVKVSTLPCHEYANNLCFLGGGEKLGRPILSPPWQDKAWTMCRWLSGWRKTRLVHYFPTLTSESINPTLSWIHIPILLFRGWGKNGPAQSFPTP